MRGDKVQKVWMGFLNIAALVHTDTLGRTAFYFWRGCLFLDSHSALFVIFKGADRESGIPRTSDPLIHDSFASHLSNQLIRVNMSALV